MEKYAIQNKKNRMYQPAINSKKKIQFCYSNCLHVLFMTQKKWYYNRENLFISFIFLIFKLDIFCGVFFQSNWFCHTLSTSQPIFSSQFHVDTTYWALTDWQCTDNIFMKNKSINAKERLSKHGQLRSQSSKMKLNNIENNRAVWITPE